MPLRDVTVPLPVAAAAAVASAAVAVATCHLAAPSVDGGGPPRSTSPPATSTGTAAASVASPSTAPAPAAADAATAAAATTTTTTAADPMAAAAPTRPFADGWLVGVELGGTTCVAACSRLSDPTVVVNRLELPTATPADTLPALVAWVAARVVAVDGGGGGKGDEGGGGGDGDGGDVNADGVAVAALPLLAIGVASFGPLVVDPSSAAYGCIRNTPKVAWRGINVLDPFRRFDVPLGLDTDVNAPALAELRYGEHGYGKVGVEGEGGRRSGRETEGGERGYSRWRGKRARGVTHVWLGRRNGGWPDWPGWPGVRLGGDPARAFGSGSLRSGRIRGSPACFPPCGLP